jgi:hypothetical protein
MDASTREYFDIEVAADHINNNKRHQYQRRFNTRKYTYVCKHVTQIVTMASYPQFSDRVALPRSITVSEFFQAVNPTNCLNHEVMTTGNPPNPVDVKGSVFVMEHVYEGHWILNFLRYLQVSEDIDCDDMDTIFFTPATTNNDGVTWAQAIMESLGSTKNQDLLVFLRQNINGAKHRIFEDGNNIIGSEGFHAASLTDKLGKIAIVGRALDYLSHPSVGEKLLATAENIERTLDALVSSPDAKSRLGTVAEGDNLKEKHRKWLHSFMKSRNSFATKQMKEWASVASEEIVKTMPRQASKTRHTEPTLNFLQALQTDSPKGFSAEKHAPLLRAEEKEKEGED